MTAIKAIVKNGQIIANTPPDWPEGVEVLIEPIPDASMIGMREEDWPTTPAGISALLKRMDAIEPLEMTPEEGAAWKAALKEQKEYEKANFHRGHSGNRGFD